ncbi:MAG: hypothetical protein ACOX8U_06130 [Bradymonadia bacterium]|jgi:hypothetical protein
MPQKQLYIPREALNNVRIAKKVARENIESQAGIQNKVHKINNLDTKAGSKGDSP